MSRLSWLPRPASNARSSGFGGACLSCFLGLFLTGCITPSYVDRAREDQPASAMVMDPVSFQVHDEFRRTPPKCVAVLPFVVQPAEGAEADDEPPLPAAEVERVRRAFYAHLAPQQKRDLELSRIDAVLQSLPGSEGQDFRAIGRALGCDALMTGVVTARGSAYLALYSRVHVGADVRIVRARDGATLWEGRHQAVSHGGFMPLTIIGAAFGVVDAALNVRDEQLERVTDDLARRLVSTIPDETDYRFVIAETVNMREGPGPRHKVRDKLHRATRVAVLDADPDHEWLAVRTSAGREGYVSVRYLSPALAEGPSAALPTP